MRANADICLVFLRLLLPIGRNLAYTYRPTTRNMHTHMHTSRGVRSFSLKLLYLSLPSRRFCNGNQRGMLGADAAAVHVCVYGGGRTHGAQPPSLSRPFLVPSPLHLLVFSKCLCIYKTPLGVILKYT